MITTRRVAAGRRVALVALAASLLTAGGAATANAATFQTTWLSKPPAGQPLVEGEASAPVASADGKVQVFVAHKLNLTGEDGTVPQVYAHDATTGRFEIVSRAGGATGAVGNDRSGVLNWLDQRVYAGATGVRVSANGRYVAFWSAATNLTADDTRGRFQLFVRDRQTKTTVLATRADGANGAVIASFPAPSANPNYIPFQVTSDGKVAFEADYTDARDPTAQLPANTPDDPIYRQGILIRDTVANTTRAGVLSADGSRIGAGWLSLGYTTVELAGLSDDGRYLFFWSLGVNDDNSLTDVPTPTGDTADAYMWRRDLRNGGKSIVVSVRADGTPTRQVDYRLRGSISDDGRYVMIRNGPAATDPWVRRDLQTNTNTGPLNVNDQGQAPTWDAEIGQQPTSNDGYVRLTRDGKHAVLAASANNFWPEIKSHTYSPNGTPMNLAEHAYLRDIETGKNQILDLTDDGSAPVTVRVTWPSAPNVAGTVGVGQPSADGSLFGIASDAINLTQSDRGTTVDGSHLYLRRVVADAPLEATTGDASGISADAATVAGTVAARAGAATARVEYGTSTAYGQSADAGAVTQGSQPQAVSARLTGLRPATTYHYRLVAQTGPDTVQRGADRTFTTSAAGTPNPSPPPGNGGGGNPVRGGTGVPSPPTPAPAPPVDTPSTSTPTPANPAALRATITSARTARTLRGGLATLATVACPPGSSACAIVAPKRITVRIAGQRYTLTVQAPRTVRAGQRASIRVRLPRQASARLKARGATVALRLTVRTGDQQTSKTVRVKITGARRAARR